MTEESIENTPEHCRHLLDMAIGPLSKCFKALKADLPVERLSATQLMVVSVKQVERVESFLWISSSSQFLKALQFDSCRCRSRN